MKNTIELLELIKSQTCGDNGEVQILLSSGEDVTVEIAVTWKDSDKYFGFKHTYPADELLRHERGIHAVLDRFVIDANYEYAHREGLVNE